MYAYVKSRFLIDYLLICPSLSLLLVVLVAVVAGPFLFFRRGGRGGGACFDFVTLFL